VNTMLDPRELLEAIVLDFGIDPTGMSKPVMLQRLAEFLVQQRQAGRLTLLVIDEAQNLSLPALEEIRMLSNLETEKSKLIQIIMIGQPELREKLSLPQLTQLRQRITVSYHLQPLDPEETANYINHRLKRAAIGSPLSFPGDVTDLIHARSRGVPRIINVIADATLLFAYGIDRRDIDMTTTQEALEELDGTGVLASYEQEGEAAAHATTVSVAETEEALRIADEVRRREQALLARERELARREQAIQVQQRVVEEEARLLAATRNARTSQPTAAQPTATTIGAPVTGASPMAGPGRTTSNQPRAAMPTAPAGAYARPAAPSLPSASVPSPAVPNRAASAYVTPSGVRVQRFERPSPVRRDGWWDRVRRIVFRVEPETGA